MPTQTRVLTATSLPAADLVHQFGGRASRAALLQHTTQDSIKRAVAGGDLHRVARGIYVLPALSAARAAAAACRGVVSHESAAQLLGLSTLFRPIAIHVTAPRGARPAPQKNVILHRRELAPAEVLDDVTTPLRTVLDCCLSLPFREALAVADSAARLVTGFEEEFGAAASRPGPGRARRLLVARHLSPAAANPFESGLRGALIGAGLTSFTPQVRIDSCAGRPQVDLADVARRIVLEADSFFWHGGRDALREDCKRYDELVRDGWIVLRFAWEHVMFEPEWVISIVRDAIARVDGRRRSA